VTCMHEVFVKGNGTGPEEAHIDLVDVIVSSDWDE
jgi:hypothetical protein